MRRRFHWSVLVVSTSLAACSSDPDAADAGSTPTAWSEVLPRPSSVQAESSVYRLSEVPWTP
jgi:hypothetical protein